MGSAHTRKELSSLTSSWVSVCGLCPMTPDGVGRKTLFCLGGDLFVGLHPTPCPETEFLDFQFFKEKSKENI